MAARRRLVAGNWKMNGLRADGRARAADVAARAAAGVLGCDVLLCPPATLLAEVGAALADGPVALGGQDCHAAAAGAHTGDVSAEMLADLGCSAVIVGHSERRADHGEDDPVVRDKAAAAHRAGLTAIICIGETLAERDGGATYGVLATQLYGSLPKGATAANTVIAYEPVWAIGTGRTATLEQIADAHDHIRTVAGATAGAPDADALRILYGGSVNPDNAADILATAGVDGALVGGASLDAAKFWAIVTAANAAET